MPYCAPREHCMLNLYYKTPSLHYNSHVTCDFMHIHVIHFRSHNSVELNIQLNKTNPGRPRKEHCCCGCYYVMHTLYNNGQLSMPILHEVPMKENSQKYNKLFTDL